MICQQCGKDNPADSKFCNNCGTRLVISQAPAPAPEPAPPEDELEWSEGVPDWLTGEGAGEPHLPGIEDDVDLPTWLLDEAGPEGEPERPSGIAGDDSAVAAQQDLPEWLRGLAPKGTGPLPSSRGESDDATPRPSLDDWLADLDEPEDAPEAPSWLAGTGADEGDAPAVESWSDELASGLEDAGDWFGDLDVGEYAPPAAEAPEDGWGTVEQSGFDMDEWLADLEPVGRQPESDVPEPPGPVDPPEETGVPDWLADDAPAAPSAEPAQFDALGAIPDWLADLEAEASGEERVRPAGTTGEEEDLTGEPEGPPADIAPLPGGEAAGWLDSLEDNWPDEGLDAAGASVPDWLAGSAAPELPESSAGDELDLPSWLEDAGAESVPADAVEAAEADAGSPETPGLDWWPAGEEPPDWLTVTDEPAEGGEAAQIAGDEPDWLSELDAAIGELEAASQGVVPDVADEAAVEFLSAGGEEPEADVAGDERPARGEAAALEETVPSWLAATELRAHLDDASLEPPVEPERVAGQGAESGDEAGGAPDWLQELEAAAPAAGMPSDMELPDWMQDVAPAGAAPEESTPASREEREPAFEAVPGEDDELPDWLIAVTAADLDESVEPAADERPDTPALEEAEEAEPWLLDDEIGDESAELDIILGQASGDEIVGADELPDWLGDVVGPEADELPAYLEDPEQVPGVLAGPRLPGWLEDSLPDDEQAAPTPLEELPPWLVPPVGAEARQPEPLYAAEDSGEWTDVLGEPSESQAAGAELSAAEIPEWLEALRPQEELRASEPPVDAEPVTEGPLAGLRGAVSAMPVIATARSAEYAGAPEISAEQQEQAELLRQLVRQQPHETARVVAGAKERARPSPWLRIVLSLLLFGAVLAGLFLPELVDVETTPVIPIAPAAGVLEAAAGQPVLVVFDYSPAYAGILNDQAAVLLRALAAQNSPVVYASQTAAGLGLGTTAVEAVAGLQAERLGYIAGETAGLRRLASCLDADLPGAAACEIYPPGTGEAAAILLLTGERDSLVDWIEQVAAVSDVPLVTGVTEALVPVVAPYDATGQIDGVLAGQAATAALAEIAGVQAEGASAAPLTLAAWLAAALLLVGNTVYFFIGLVGSRRTKKA